MYLRQLFSLLIVGVIIYFIVRLATRKKREAKYLNRLEVERLENERKLLEYQDRQRERRELEEERQALAQKGNYFNFIFQQCRLMTNDTEKQTPYYVAEQEISRDEKIIVFSSLVPLSEWYDKKELLEEYLELKIIKIEQEKKNMTDTSLSRTIKLTVTSGELPNMIEWHDDYLNKNANILNIGVGYRGIIGMNLEIYPHTFIAGTSGSGKTNLLKCLIHQSLIKNYDVVLIDFKRGVSFTEFENQVKIYYEYETARNALKELVAETIKRLDAFREHRVDTLRKYNAIPNITKFKRIIIFIDELAELMTVNDKKMASDFYDSIETLTRISRAVGINLIMATQRVDSTIISGQIKSNVILTQIWCIVITSLRSNPFSFSGL